MKKKSYLYDVSRKYIFSVKYKIRKNRKKRTVFVDILPNHWDVRSLLAKNTEARSGLWASPGLPGLVSWQARPGQGLVGLTKMAGPSGRAWSGFGPARGPVGTPGLSSSYSNTILPCIEITTDMIGINATYQIIVRHYLDPQTATGPHKDALPRHRVLVFNPVPIA